MRSVAAPLAGSTIGNQATATYTDSNGTPLTSTSNVALTIVQQVASLTLDTSQSKPGAPGAQVVFPHTIRNTGNGVDSFTLSTIQSLTDIFDLSGLEIYADANGDGLPDNSTAITTTGPIAPGATFNFVIVGTVPSDRTSGQNAEITVRAASTFTPGLVMVNTDTVVVSQNGVVVTSLALSTASSASPGGPHTYTLTFTNIGNLTATNLTLINAIPAGLTYVSGSARWSGSPTALTDASGGDPLGISYNFGVTTPNTATAVIASLDSGQSGTLTFQVNVNSGLSAGVIPHNASFTFNDGVSVVGPYTTNTVVLNITQSAGVVVDGATIASANQGATVNFLNVITNTGSGTESYELTLMGSTFPSGTTFVLVRSDGVTTILDSNGNGTPDTGPMTAGLSMNVFIRAILPPDATGGPFVVTLTATAASNPAVFASAVNTLTAITANLVDLSVDGTIGAGPGPGAVSVNTLPGLPGAATRFQLTIENLSGVADNYNLSVSGVADFSTLGLPPGWTVVFRNAAEGVITSTGVINAGASLVVYADVTPPAGQAAVTQNIFFRVLSPSTNSSDVLFNAMTVASVRTLAFVTNNTGQISTGGVADYGHTLTNTGTVLEGDGPGSSIALSVTNSQPGWTAIVYHDANGNGLLDPGEAQVSDLAFVSNGAAGLAPGESVRFLVRVFAPAGAAAGTVNTTTITATTINGTLGTTVPPIVSVSNVSTVVATNIQVEKRHAFDANNDGAPDGAYVTTPLTTGAVPGARIRYQITVTNLGTETAVGVLVHDVTPAFTVYSTLVPAATTVGTVTTVPADGSTGTFLFTLGDLAPGASAVITFGVRIDP